MLEINPPTSKSERLFIYRRRSGLKIREIAPMLAISESQYMRWENIGGENCPDIDVGQLSDIESCVLLRRRHRLSQEQLAERWGRSHISVVRMEAGVISHKELVEYWKRVTSEQ